MSAKNLVFDLDDTLLPEADYVRSGMQAVADHCSARLREVACATVAVSAAALELPVPSLSSAREIAATLFRCYLNRLFDQGVRGDTFNRLLADFPVLQSPQAVLAKADPTNAGQTCSCATDHAPQAIDAAGEATDCLTQPQAISINELVTVYRTHKPHITLAPEWVALLKELKEHGCRLGIISDGPLAAQSAKAEALQLRRWFDPVILTDVWGKEFWKPSPRAYQAIEDAWGVSGKELCYIGDNPAKDFLSPNQRGWTTIRFRRPGQLHYAAENATPGASAQIECDNINTLRKLLG